MKAKREILSLPLALGFAAALLPASALAARQNAPAMLYVGNYQITSGDTKTCLKAGSTQGSMAVAAKRSDRQIRPQRRQPGAKGRDGVGTGAQMRRTARGEKQLQ